MKNKIFTQKSIAMVAILAIVLSSCGTSDKVTSSNLIQKRKYNNGYFISLFAKKAKSEKINSDKGISTNFSNDHAVNQNQNEIEDVSNQDYNTNNLIASAENELIIKDNNNDFNKKFSIKDSKSNISAIQPVTECDIIILKTGDEIKAKVLEVGQTEIKYKMCNNFDGPTYSELKSKIFMIQYANGTKDVFNTESTKTANNDNSNANTSPSETSGKSQTVAFVLALLIGVIGIHRFYIGYIGIGIIQLLTLGFCGIWTLIDLIRILTGDLKPKNGEYKDKW
jgi:hypothetical protein